MQVTSVQSRATFHQPHGASGCPVRGRSRLQPARMVPATISSRPCTRFSRSSARAMATRRRSLPSSSRRAATPVATLPKVAAAAMRPLLGQCQCLSKMALTTTVRCVNDQIGLICCTQRGVLVNLLGALYMAWQPDVCFPHESLCACNAAVEGLQHAR